MPILFLIASSAGAVLVAFARAYTTARERLEDVWQRVGLGERRGLKYIAEKEDVLPVMLELMLSDTRLVKSGLGLIAGGYMRATPRKTRDRAMAVRAKVIEAEIKAILDSSE